MKFFKKKLLIMAVFVLIAVGMSGNICEAKGRQFVVGFDAEFPPYGYLDENGEYVGFDLSLAEEVCKRRGCNPWVPLPARMASGTGCGAVRATPRSSQCSWRLCFALCSFRSHDHLGCDSSVKSCEELLKRKR